MRFLTPPADVPTMPTWPMYVYGASYSTLNQAFFTAGRHWTQLLAAKLRASSLSSYGVNGSRSTDIAYALIDDGARALGSRPPVSGSEWPGTSARRGLVILDGQGNDTGHYANNLDGDPDAITTANTLYLDAIKGTWRTILALMTSESRIEHTAATRTGTWVNHNFTSPGASSGTLAYANAVGAATQYSVTPPQFGPHAGKVYWLTTRYTNGGITTAATINVSIDGGTNVPVAVSAWEQYTGYLNELVAAVPMVIPVTLPIDGAAHTVKFTHAGAALAFLYDDAMIIPSEDPNPILVMGAETKPAANAFTSAGMANYAKNLPLVTAAIQSVVAEFPTARWVASTVTSQAFWTDGLHLKDLGQEQRCNDAYQAVKSLKPLLDNQALAARA